MLTSTLFSVRQLEQFVVVSKVLGVKHIQLTAVLLLVIDTLSSSDASQMMFPEIGEQAGAAADVRSTTCSKDLFEIQSAEAG